MACKDRSGFALVLALALVCPAPASAALTCEQVLAIAQATVRYRDEGYSLGQVLGAMRDVESQKKLTPIELEVLRRSVSLVYLSQASPEEVALECVRARDAAKP